MMGKLKFRWIQNLGLVPFGEKFHILKDFKIVFINISRARRLLVQILETNGNIQI